jgi:hypothetical protein
VGDGLYYPTISTLAASLSLNNFLCVSTDLILWTSTNVEPNCCDAEFMLFNV